MGYKFQRHENLFDHIKLLDAEVVETDGEVPQGWRVWLKAHT